MDRGERQPHWLCLPFLLGHLLKGIRSSITPHQRVKISLTGEIVATFQIPPVTLSKKLAANLTLKA